MGGWVASILYIFYLLGFLFIYKDCAIREGVWCEGWLIALENGDVEDFLFRKGKFLKFFHPLSRATSAEAPLFLNFRQRQKT